MFPTRNMEYSTTVKIDTDFSSLMTFALNATNTTGLLPPYWTLPERICLSVVLIAIIIVSLVGNSLVIISVAYFKDMQRKTYVLIANLAVADFGVSLLCMPVSLITVISGDWIFGDVLCAINGFLEALFLVASIHGLMYISIHKYFQLSYPLKRIIDKKWATVMIILTWLVAFTVAMAPVVGLTENEYKPGASQCGPKFPEGDIQSTIHAAYSVLMGFIIPWSVIVFCYSSIFRHLTKHGQRMIRHSSMDQRRVFKQQKRITVTLFVILIVFFICWCPFIIFNIFGFTRGFENILIWPNAYIYVMGYLNSAINPVIYAWRNRSFKKAFREIRYCCNTQSTFITDNGVMLTKRQKSSRRKRILYPPITPSSPDPDQGSPTKNRFQFNRNLSHISVVGSRRNVAFRDENGLPLSTDQHPYPTSPLAKVLDEPPRPITKNTSNQAVRIDTVTEYTNSAFEPIVEENHVLTDFPNATNDQHAHDETCDKSPSINNVDLHEVCVDAEEDEANHPITAPQDTEHVPTTANGTDRVPRQHDMENSDAKLDNLSPNGEIQKRQELPLTVITNARKSSVTKIVETLSNIPSLIASSNNNIDNLNLISEGVYT